MAEQKKEEQQHPGTHKVSLSWYPNDWKTSDTFLDVDDPLVRYYYLEIIFLLYLNKGLWEINRSRFQKLMRVTITDEIWSQVDALFVTEEIAGVKYFSHESVDKRIDKRGKTSAQNGEKGGRPKGEEKPNNNLIPEPKNNLSKPNKPISTIEDKIIEAKGNVSEPLASSISSGVQSSDPFRLEDGRVELERFEKYNGKFPDPEKRKVIAKWWKKYTDQETRSATIYFRHYMASCQGQGVPATLTEFFKKKWFKSYIERSKSPQP